MTALTRRQQEIYEYLREHGDQFTRPPSLEELCVAIGMKSRGSMHKHIQALVEAGLLEPMNGRQRGIRLVEASVDDGLPFLGYIAAGQPIEAVVAEQRVVVPAQLRGSRPCYVLGVKGDSMMEAGILDGDWVVVEQRSHAHDGEIVVALVDGAEATLKRIEQRPGEVVLHPANAALKSMRYDPNRVTIQGVVIGQMRAYR